eukprot:858910_1
MSVVVAKRLDAGEVAKREKEEQKVIQAATRARANSGCKVTLDSDSSSEKSFGSRLNEEMMKTRPRTMSDAKDSAKMNVKNVAMTPDERRNLEEQMKSQLSHPLMREMQRNAELETQRHLLEHAERRIDRVISSRDELERLMERAREQEYGLSLFGGAYHHEEDEEDDIFARIHDGVDVSARPNIDDLFLIEAAYYLSAREDSMRRRNNRSRSGQQGRRDNALIRALLSGVNGRSSRNNAANNESESENNDSRERGTDAQNDNNSNSRDNHLSAADLLFGGMSESSQIEMAIQMSLREAEEREAQQQSEQNETEESTSVESVTEVDSGEETITFEAVTEEAVVEEEKTEQPTTEQTATEQNTTMKTTTKQADTTNKQAAITTQADTQQAATEQTESKQATTEKADTEKAATENTATEQTAIKQTGIEEVVAIKDQTDQTNTTEKTKVDEIAIKETTEQVVATKDQTHQTNTAGKTKVDEITTKETTEENGITEQVLTEQELSVNEASKNEAPVEKMEPVKKRPS